MSFICVDTVSTNTSACLQAFISCWLIYIQVVFYCVSRIHWLCCTVWERNESKEGACVFVWHRYRSVRAYVCVREKTDLTACVYTRDSQQSVCVCVCVCVCAHQPSVWFSSHLNFLFCHQCCSEICCRVDQTYTLAEEHYSRVPALCDLYHWVRLLTCSYQCSCGFHYCFASICQVSSQSVSKKDTVAYELACLM